MTLAPVFRSKQAVEMLQSEGVWEKFQAPLALQIQGVATVSEDLAAVIGPDYRYPLAQWVAEKGRQGGDPLVNLQDYFFLTFFLSLFEGLGVDPARVPFYAEMDFCIQGIITAADNLFDDQDKTLLPLRSAAGSRYRAILQLMSFERLVQRVGRRAVAAGWLAPETFDAALLGLMDQMAHIGLLEGSEEAGVSEIPTPAQMVDSVHRVRGGELFALAFIAPRTIETGAVAEKMAAAEPAVARFGTAFQIVDDLTDFEFDLTRRSHNLLVAQIHHHGTPEEKAQLKALWEGAQPQPGMVEGLFAESARAVLQMARDEAAAALQALEALGFWFPARLADAVVQAIVGLDGVARMDALADKK